MDELGARDAATFRQALRVLKDPAVSRDLRIINFFDAYVVKRGEDGRVNPWNFDAEKRRILQEELSHLRLRFSPAAMRDGLSMRPGVMRPRNNQLGLSSVRRDRRLPRA